MQLNLNQRELSWLVSVTSERTYDYLLYRFHEKILFDPKSVDRNISNSLNYFGDRGLRPSYYDYESALFTDQTIKTLAQFITTTKNLEHKQHALSWLNRVVSKKKGGKGKEFTINSKFAAIINEDLWPRFVQVFLNPQSHDPAITLCLIFFVNESYKDQEKVITTLKSLVFSTPRKNTKRKIEIIETIYFIEEIHKSPN